MCTQGVTRYIYYYTTNCAEFHGYEHFTALSQ